nr:leucine-rich repeat domain-containing protein [uncultured Bacteroides sp.]
MKTTTLCKYTLFVFSLFLNWGIRAQEVQLTLNTTGGALSYYLGNQKDVVTDLTLIGSFNGWDISTLHEMAKLTKLNIAQAKPVEGGFFYFGRNIYVENNKIPPCMFYSMSGLTSLVLPTTITAIGNQAFQDCQGISNITIPSGVTQIDTLVFAYCTGLKSINMAGNITEICNYAFLECSSLSSFTIPASVNTLGKTPFSGCTGLREFIVDSANPIVCDIDGVLFSKDQSTILAYPNAKSASYTMPESTTRIEDYAFEWCEDLGSVVINNNVNSLGEGAFYGCKGLVSATLSNKIPSIGANTFYNCKNLTTISIPASVSSVGSGAFGLCSGLTSIHSYRTTAPSATTTTFTSVNTSTCIVYVPKGSYSSYKSATGWSAFKYINEEGTSVPQLEAKSIKVYTVQGGIIVEGTNIGDIISVYDVTGALVQSIRVTDETTLIYVPANHIYLIRITGKVFKIAL